MEARRFAPTLAAPECGLNALENESTNFWETKWLQHQASRIEGELSELKI